MKTYAEVEIQLHALLFSALETGKRSASRTGRFTSKGRAKIGQEAWWASQTVWTP
jgi:hypothetical protein